MLDWVCGSETKRLQYEEYFTTKYYSTSGSHKNQPLLLTVLPAKITNKTQQATMAINKATTNTSSKPSLKRPRVHFGQNVKHSYESDLSKEERRAVCWFSKRDLLVIRSALKDDLMAYFDNKKSTSDGCWRGLELYTQAHIKFQRERKERRAFLGFGVKALQIQLNSEGLDAHDAIGKFVSIETQEAKNIAQELAAQDAMDAASIYLQTYDADSSSRLSTSDICNTVPARVVAQKVDTPPQQVVVTARSA